MLFLIVDKLCDSMLVVILVFKVCGFDVVMIMGDIEVMVKFIVGKFGILNVIVGVLSGGKFDVVCVL